MFHIFSSVFNVDFEKVNISLLTETKTVLIKALKSCSINDLFSSKITWKFIGNCKALNANLESLESGF